ncbi:MAG: hypothetical protein AAF772_16815, partial [Acidobacteriota bacterium]
PAAIGAAAGARIGHDGDHALFGASPPPLPPRGDLGWLMRERAAQLYAFSGVRHDLRYAFAPTPEGLDSYLGVALAQALRTLDDPQRLRILAASGVRAVLVHRPLRLGGMSGDDPGAARQRLHLPAGQPGADGVPRWRPLYALELLRPIDEVRLVTDVRRAPDLNATLALLASPTFDPRRTAVIEGNPAVVVPADAAARPPGTAQIVRATPHALTVDTDAAHDGLLVVQRAHLGLYRAAVDGAPATVQVADFHRIGVSVPAGSHRVQLWIDRRPAALAAVGSALGLLGLALLALLARGRRTPQSRSAR